MTNDQSLLNQCLQLGTGEADCELPELEKLLALALDVLVDGGFSRSLGSSEGVSQTRRKSDRAPRMGNLTKQAGNPALYT